MINVYKASMVLLPLLPLFSIRVIYKKTCIHTFSIYKRVTQKQVTLVTSLNFSNLGGI
jgi:hypothetical protein